MTSNKFYFAAICVTLAGCTSPNSIPKVLASPTANLTVAENGMGAEFKLHLTERPSADVKVTVYSDNPNEGTVEPSELVFSHNDPNWDIARSFLVRGVDDHEKDGNQVFHIAFGATESADDAWAGLTIAPIEVTNMDDDSPNVLPTTTALTLVEGRQATFDVKLTTRPRGRVLIDLTATKGAPFTLSPAQLEFFPRSWDKPITVRVTLPDNTAFDNYKEMAIGFAPAESEDTDYLGLVAPPLKVTAQDDDKLGLVVTGAPTMMNEGTNALFSVKLSSQPTADVTVPVTASGSGLTVTPPTLTFTSAHWSEPQTVTIAANLDKFIPATDTTNEWVRLGKPSTSDPNYASLGATDVKFTLRNADYAGFTLSRTVYSTSEHDGTSNCASVNLNLTASVAKDVTFTLTSTTPGEGAPSAATVTIPPYNTYGSFTVCGVDDNVVDGNKSFSITVAVKAGSDPHYLGVSSQNVDFTNYDDDAEGDYCSAPIALTAGQTTSQTTAGKNDDFHTNVCSYYTSSPAPDEVFSITIPAGQMLKVTVTNASFTPWISIVSTCKATYPTCLSSTTYYNNVSYRNSSSDPLPVFIVIDAASSYSYGSFNILPELLP